MLKVVIPELVILEAQEGEEVLELLQNVKPDIIFLDVSMNGMNGIETCKHLLEKYPEIPVVMLTQHCEKGLIINLFRMGVSSFLTKDVDISEVKLAIEYILRGEKYFPKKIEEIIDSSEESNLAKIEFGFQEKMLLRLLSSGKTSKEIANKMNLAIKTITTYRERLLAKTKTKNVAELISYCFRNGIMK